MSLSVIIVDDEPMVIESIRWGIDWEMYDTVVCATFTDSLQALHYMKENHVDIVITDINMPPFNGLVLCSRVLEIKKQVQLIIISGYADFSYAQKSIHYGAVGYCLKPIDYDELTLCIKKAVKNLTPQIPVVKPEFIEALYENNYSLLSQYLSLEGLNGSLYCAISIGKKPLLKCFWQSIGLNEYLYLSNHPLISMITKEMLQGDCVWGIGIYEQAIGISSLQETVYQLLYNAYQFFFKPGEKIFDTQVRYDAELLKKAKSLFACPEELENLLKQKKVNHIRFAADLYNAALQYEKEERYLYSYNQVIYLFTDYQELVQKIINLLRKGCSKGMDYESGNKKFLELIKYINENYAQDISAQSLADQLSLNPCYISQLFKKETGTNVVKYVTNLRIKHAQELLITTDLTVNEISEACGFQDYFYFIKIFKRITGKAPTAFRSGLLV